MKIKTLTLLSPLFASSAFAAPLQLDVYNPRDRAISPVSSTLVSGPEEAILSDAQFSTKNGEQPAQMIRASSKALKAIVITSDDPDFYFGLEPIVKAFPQVKVLTTPQVVNHIRATKKARLQFWGLQMKDDAPTSLTVPQATMQMQFTVDDETLKPRHTSGYAARIWIPANQAIISGTGMASGIHVWTVNTQSEQQRSAWRSVPSEMQNLQPTQVIPGYYIGDRPTDDKAIRFTQGYLQSFEQTLGVKEGSGYVIRTMTAAWPNLTNVSSLELSAKVNSGKMKW